MMWWRVAVIGCLGCAPAIPNVDQALFVCSEPSECTETQDCVGGVCVCRGCLPPPACKNADGRIECSCPSGFSLDGERCVDVDECLRDNGGCGGALCRNTVGTNRCDCVPGGGVDGGCASRSCADALAQNPTAKSGTYLVDPDGLGAASAVPIWCDIDPDGGAWALLAQAPFGFRSLGRPAWVDVVSVNFFMTDAGVAADSTPPVDVGPDAGFFALTYALSSLPFRQVRFVEGRVDSIQRTAELTTLRAIHDGGGVASLYSADGGLTGMMLVLGNASQSMEDTVPCYYPQMDAAACEIYHAGDTGAQTTAFFVGDVSTCTTAVTSVANRLWGSRDCVGTNTSGGYAGFNYTRPIEPNTPNVHSGYLGAGWKVWLR